MRNIQVITTVHELTGYVEHVKLKAQIELINDHIRPYNADKARRLISSLKKKCCGPVRKFSAPREFDLKVVPCTSEDFSELTQYLVREIN